MAKQDKDKETQVFELTRKLNAELVELANNGGDELMMRIIRFANISMQNPEQAFDEKMAGIGDAGGLIKAVANSGNALWKAEQFARQFFRQEYMELAALKTSSDLAGQMLAKVLGLIPFWRCVFVCNISIRMDRR